MRLPLSPWLAVVMSPIQGKPVKNVKAKEVGGVVMGAWWGRGNAESVKHFRAALPKGADAPLLTLFNILITVH